MILFLIESEADVHTRRSYALDAMLPDLRWYASPRSENAWNICLRFTSGCKLRWRRKQRGSGGEEAKDKEALSLLRYRESHRRFNSRNFSLVFRVGSALIIDASISSIPKGQYKMLSGSTAYKRSSV